MKPPSNLFYFLGRRDKKIKLLKALYRSKQAGREWYTLFDSFLKAHDFKPNAADHCFYYLIINDLEYIILLLYVDDVIIASTCKTLTMHYVNLIGKRFHISFSCELKSYECTAESECVDETAF